VLPRRPTATISQIVAPDFPGDQHCVVGACPSERVEYGHVIAWQIVEDALAILYNKGIQEDSSSDKLGAYFSHFLNYRSAKTMAHQDDVLQPLLLNVSDD
jgi:hypothetical protein